MALLSASDVLLFFTLLLNSIAIARPWGSAAAKPHSTRDDGSEGVLNSDTSSSAEGGRPGAGDDDTAPLLTPSPSSTGVLAGLSDQGFRGRCNDLLLGFRRLGIFIALWNFAIMIAMVFVFN
jgi:hypothetical protein